MSTYFITDVHLGSGSDSAQRERDLVAFLNAIEPTAERLILLGDIFDFWFSYKYVVPRGYVRLLGKLAQMADAGVEIHYFIGNHDMWIFDYFQKEIGIIMHNAPLEMSIEGKQFLMGHGDGLGGIDKSYNLLKRIFRGKCNQKLFSIVNPLIGFGIAECWSESSRQSHNEKYMNYLGDENEGIVIFCQKELQQKPYDYFVFGHRHLAMQKTLTVPLAEAPITGQNDLSAASRTAQYVNVGDWIAHRNYAVFDGHTLQLQSFQSLQQ